MNNSFKEDKIEKIEKIGLDKSAGLHDNPAELSQSRVKFDDALAKADPSRIKTEIAQQTNPVPVQPVENRPSILDIAGKPAINTAAIPPPTPTQLLDRAELTRQKFTNAIDLVKQNLDHPIAAPERASMTASIQHTDRYLNQAVSQTTGVEMKSAIDVSERPPMIRFLGFLTDGEKRMDTLINGLQGLDLQRNRLTPEGLLSIQIRLGFVQTELEFFTNVLNKSLESMKTIMNVQI